MNEERPNKSAWGLCCENLLDRICEGFVEWADSINEEFATPLEEKDEEKPVPPTNPTLLRGL